LIYLYFLGETKKPDLKAHLLKTDTVNQRDIAICDIYDALILMVSQILRDLWTACGPLQQLIEQLMETVEKHFSNIILNNYRNAGHRYPHDAFEKAVSSNPYSNPSQIPECIEISNKIFNLHKDIFARFDNLFKKYTAYINAELIKYLLLYGLRRKVSIWNHETKSHKATSFNYKKDYEDEEAYWREVYNNTPEN